MLADPNTRTVNHLQLAIVGLGNRLKQAVPDARPPPAHKAVVAGCVRAIALGNVCPGAACQSALKFDPLSASNIDPLGGEQARRCVALT